MYAVICWLVKCLCPWYSMSLHHPYIMTKKIQTSRGGIKDSWQPHGQGLKLRKARGKKRCSAETEHVKSKSEIRQKCLHKPRTFVTFFCHPLQYYRIIESETCCELRQEAREIRLLEKEEDSQGLLKVRTWNCKVWEFNRNQQKISRTQLQVWTSQDLI